MMGAWPVFGFFGLDVLLLYIAFRVSYGRRPLRACDGDAVDADGSQDQPRARCAEWQLNPLWARLEKEEYEEYGIARLFLVSRGKQLTIGSFLGPDEKADFAEALSRALGEARRGPALSLSFRKRVVRPAGLV